jgi:hypothetical protein
MLGKRALGAWGSALLLTVAACGDGGGTDEDGGVALRDGGMGGGEGGIPLGDAGPPPDPDPLEIDWLDRGAPDIAPPEIPWAAGGDPITWTCPEGWREATVDGIGVCEPFPEGGPIECPDGLAQYPGTGGCAPIGDGCPAIGQDFADTTGVDPSTRLLYVDRTVEVDGDGSLAMPFRTLSSALDAATASSLIVFGRGEFFVDRAWPAGVSVLGRCADETFLVGDDAAANPYIVDVASGDVTITGVTLGPSEALGAARVSGATSSLTLNGVAFRRLVGAPSALLAADGATLRVDRLFVNTIEFPSDTMVDGGGLLLGAAAPTPVREGSLLSVEGGATAAVATASVQGVRGMGVDVTGTGSSATLEDVAIVGTQVAMLNADAATARAVAGGSLTLRRALVSGSLGLAVLVDGDGSSLTLEDAVVRGTVVRGRARDDAAPVVLGLLAEGATADLARVHIEGGQSGLTLNDGTVAVEDVVVRQLEAPGVTTGIQQNGATSTVERAAVVGLEGGVALGLGSGTATVSDLVVRDVARGVLTVGAGTHTVRRAVIRDYTLDGVASGSFQVANLTLEDAQIDGGSNALGISLLATGAMSLTADRVAVRNTLGNGIRVENSPFGEPDTEAFLTDVVVDRVDIDEGGFGYGLLAVQVGGPRLTLTRCSITNASVAGIFAANSSSTMEDVLVAGTRQTEAGRTGFGVFVGGMGLARMDRVLIERNFEVGLAVTDGMELEAEDLVVRGTTPAGCEDCLQPPGVNLGVYRTSTAEITRFLLADGFCGLRIPFDGTVTASDGTIRNHGFAGVCRDTSTSELTDILFEMNSRDIAGAPDNDIAPIAGQFPPF